MSKRKYYEVYRYDELTPEAQEAAIEKFREAEDLPFLEDYMNELLSELLKENKIAGDGKVQYSLNYRQGDGAMFEGSFVWNDYSVVVKQYGYYVHSNCKIVDIENHQETGEDVTDEDSSKFEDIYQEICQKLEEAGYAYIEGETSDERYLSEIEERKCWFKEDGTLDECEE